MKLSVLRLAMARWMAIAALVVLGAALPQTVSAQHTSTECPAQSATVTSGGTVTINISDCQFEAGFGGIGDIDGGSFGAADFEDHGTATTRHTSGQWFLDYSHNGTTGIGSTDVFELSDGSLTGSGDIRFTITINASASPITVTPGALPTLTAGSSFSQTLTASGGLAPYSYTLQSGVLPPGISLNNGGLLSGTPTQRGAYSFSVRATDSTSPTAQFVDKGYTGTVQNPSLSLATPTVTLVSGASASAQLATSGGVSPHSYATEPPGTPMPFGLSLSSGGLITGTPTGTGTATIQLRVTDASTGPGQYFELETLTITVAAPSLAISPAALNPMISGTAFSQTLTATGGTGPYSFTILSGGLPTGLSLSATGEISGTPTRRGAYSFSVQAQDSLGAIGTQAYSGTVGSTPLVTTPLTFTFNQGAPANVALSTTGGVTPYTYTLPIDQLPAGLSLSASGVITGTPTTVGSSSVTLRVRDASTPGTFAQNSTLTINVVSLPGVSIAVSPATVAEDGGANLVYTVTRDVVSASPLTVNISASGTATSGSDYSGGVANVVIPANAASASITIDPASDATTEADETVILSVAAGAGYTVGIPASATGTIVNDDLPTASIAVSPASVVEDGAGNLTYMITLDTAAFAPVSVNFTLGGTASNGSDYASLNSPVIIAAGATSQTIVVDPNADGGIEADETVIVTLASGAGYNVGAPASATGTIINDDVPSIFVDSVSVAEGNSGTTDAVFTISLSAPAAVGGVTFDISTIAQTATAGQDFVANSQSGVTIAEGASSTSFTVAVNGDLTNELDESFAVQLSNVVGAREGGFRGTGTITNDDALPTVSIGSLSVIEGNIGTSTLAFPLTLDAPSGQTVIVNVATANGTAIAGSDYVAASGSFAFQPGETSKTFPVTVNGDTLPEPDENFTVMLSGAANASIGTGTGTGTIINDDVPLDILPENLPNGSVGIFYSAILTTDGGIAPYRYAVTAGTLPAGLHFDANGTLSGTPVAAGNASFTITATDSSGAPGPYSASRAYVVSIAAPFIELTPVTLPNADFGVPYSQTITADGSVGPYSFAVTSGALPDGITLASDGTLSGTPTRGGATGFTITATDATAVPYSGARAYSITVNVPVLVLPATTLPDGGTDTAYSAQINLATGGIAPYSYAVTSGQLPIGLSFSPGGAITGTPTAAGSFTFAVTATDSNVGSGPSIAAQTYTINIVNTPPVANPVTVNVPYNAGLTPVPLSITGNANAAAVVTPPTHGRAIVQGLTIEYIPDSGYAGPDSFTYIASNNGANSAPATVTISVANPAITVTAGGSLTATVGTPYSETFTFNGGTQPFTNYQVTGLPAGMQAGSSGANTVAIIGTPTSAGSFSLAVSAIDASTGSGPFSTSQTFTLVVNAPALALTPATGSFTASYAAAYSQAITATGGIGPYTYGLTGNLPAGVTLNPSTGLLSGSPTASGVFNFAVTATDTGSTGAGAPFTVQGNYSLTVAAPVVTVTPTALPLATAGAAYTATLTAAGGVGPYSFASSGGGLPAGLSLSTSGIVSGTPTAAGAFTFTINVTDANGQMGTASLTLTVANSVVTVTPATLPGGTQGVAYSQRITAAGGIAPYSFAVSSGVLPTGLTINATTGVIAGTPTGSGDATFAITVTDSTGGTPSTATITYTLRIVARPNPANDPEVRGLVQAQVNSARRFVDIQVGNFNRRLEGLRRGGGSGGFSNSLRIRASDHCIDTITAWTNPICANAGGNAAGGAHRQPGGFGTNPHGGPLTGGAMGGGLLGGGAIGSAEAGDGATSAANADEPGSSTASPLSIWAGGTIRWGDRDEKTGRPSERFESEGVTFGADYRFNPSFAAGVGVGLGRETTDVGRNGSQSEGEAKTLAIYGSHLLGGGLYVDWLAGYQWLDFDLRRYVTLSGAMVNSSRSGRQWFGSVSAGADIESGDWRFTPYARIDAQRGTLNGYTENSGSVFDLTYLDQDVAFTSIGAGAKIDYRIAVENGFFLPRLRLEYQRDIERDSEALVAYFDQLSGPFNGVPLTGYARSRFLMGLGVEMMIGDRTAVDVEYSRRDNSGAGIDQGVLINVKQAF